MRLTADEMDDRRSLARKIRDMYMYGTRLKLALCRKLEKNLEINKLLVQ